MKVILDTERKKIQVLEPVTLQELAALEGRLAVAFGWQCSECLEVVSDLLPVDGPNFYPPVFQEFDWTGSGLVTRQPVVNVA